MSTRQFLAAFVSLLSLISLASGDDRISVPMYAGGSQITRDNTERIELALRGPSECRFVDEVITTAIATLGQRHHIETWIDQQALQDEGVSLDQRVTLTKSGISLEAILDLLLEPLGLTFVNQDGVLRITTLARADEMMSTRIYPVSDLVGANYRILIQVIVDNTSGKWIDIDQEGGNASSFPRSRSLIIRQTRKVHGEIESIIVALRRSKKMNVDLKSNRPADLQKENIAGAFMKTQPRQPQQLLSPPVSQPIRIWSAGG